jgi:hypothetical protein
VVLSVLVFLSGCICRPINTILEDSPISDEPTSTISSTTVGDTSSAGTRVTVESSSGGIAAFARDWWWSRDRNQDGVYGETRVRIDLPSNALVESARLYWSGSYSQQSGNGFGVVYLSSSRQVAPRDSAHDKGNYWYGDEISYGIKVGSVSLDYSGDSGSFDVTSYVKGNPSSTYYIAVKNNVRADIGFSSLKLEVTYL